MAITERTGRRWLGIGSYAALMALAVCAAAADKPQAPAYAVIAGTVWNAEHHPAAGVKVSARRTNEKKSRWQGTSDVRGEFAFRVPAEAADYVVVAEPGGQRRPVEKTVHIDYDERTDIGLHLTE